MRRFWQSNFLQERFVRASEHFIPRLIMKLPRREFLHLAAGGAALPAVSRIATAQTYPTKPVRIVVPFAPAGTTDIVTRLIGQWLSERLGEQFIVENRPGGAGNIGTEAVVHALPDGYTLLSIDVTAAINATLFDKLKFSFIRDIAPIASIARVANVLVVNPLFPAKTVPEFITYIKANPGKISLASAGIGSPNHLCGELFKRMAGVDMTHVPYRGGGPAIADLLGGQVDVTFAVVTTAIEYIRAGKLRALAVTSATRQEALPDTPIMGDFIPGYEAIGWFGLFAPKNTPAEIVDKLNKEINAALADPKMRARLADLGGTVLSGSPADLGRLVVDDTEKWGKVIRAANIKVE
jgi:tripartite-type tricarboxylate transporter receptor subunit TctC